MKFSWKWQILFVGACITLLNRCNDNPQSKGNNEFTLNAVAEEEVLLRDTLLIKIAEIPEGDTFSYCWMREDSWTIDTTDDPRYTTAWQFPDTGRQRLLVWAIGRSGEGKRSTTDTVEVRVRYCRPVIKLAGDTVAFVNDPLLFRVQASDTDGTIERIEWSADRAGIRLTGATEDSLTLKWGKNDTGYHVLRVVAVDNDGFHSDTDSIIIRISRPSSSQTLTGDTSVSINDTLTVVNKAVAVHGVITEYQWSVDPEGAVWLTTPSDTLSLVWRLPDSGTHVIRARILDDAGIVSAAESLVVRVFAVAPVIELDGPSTAVAGDSATYRVSGTDGDGEIVRYRWSIGTASGPQIHQTIDSIITVAWTERDTGSRTVSVAAADDDSLLSQPAERSVAVKSARPVMVPLDDTLLTNADSLLITRTLADTTLVAAEYFWDVDGNGDWDDSSEASQYVITYNGSPMVTPIVGVRDTRNNFFRDTLLIVFNRPPQIDSLSLSDGDTVWMPENSASWSLGYNCKVSDPNGDSLTRFITWGRGGYQDTFAGTDTIRLPFDSVGGYQWCFCVEDSRGQRTLQSGTTFIGSEHTICFSGHSIVAGFAGDSIGGGFREGVLARLRDSLGAFERLRAVGPFTTHGLMSGYPADDSCFAVSGSFAREMQLLMDQAYPDLTADIWVLMLGVNGSFSSIEMNATVSMVNRMLSRNPAARIYVLTSPPFSGVSAVQRDFYNNSVRDSIAQMASGGAATFIVEADSLLGDGSVIYDSLFSDVVHPNQAGYDLLRDEILRVMWSRTPAVLAGRKNE